MAGVAQLIVREIAYRRLGFGLAVLSTAAAVGTAAVQLGLLGRHDRASADLLAAKEAAAKTRLAAFEDDFRRITKDMGFNLLILPAEQNLADLYAEDFAVRTMPEEFATRLAKAKVLTVNHVLPMLQRKIRWPEADRTILLNGVRGEVYIQSKKQKPILEPVAADEIVLGHELHAPAGLKPGGRVTLMGKEFRIGRCNPARGTRDDITVWIHLARAQEMLALPGLINGIQALECGCAADRLSKIRAEIGALLPDTQVVEFAGQAVARAESRNRAEREARESLAAEAEAQAQLREGRVAAAAVLVPAIVLGAALCVGGLMLANVRERRGEIGILRALGLRGRQVLGLVLGRAAVIGAAGALLGLAGAAVFLVFGVPEPHPPWSSEPDFLSVMPWGAFPQLLTVLPWDEVGWAVPAAVALAVVSAWPPAVLALRTDPAEILREC